MTTRLRELLAEIMAACEMIGYATSGNERASHRASRDKAKAELLSILNVEGDGVASNATWQDPTGFSVAGILDEANNWTRRETGKQMLLNYAAALEHFAKGSEADVDESCDLWNDRAAQPRAVPDGFTVGARVTFRGEEYTIKAYGDVANSFDLHERPGSGEVWNNVPASMLAAAPSPGESA